MSLNLREINYDWDTSSKYRLYAYCKRKGLTEEAKYLRKGLSGKVPECFLDSNFWPILNKLKGHELIYNIVVALEGAGFEFSLHKDNNGYMMISDVSNDEHFYVMTYTEVKIYCNDLFRIEIDQARELTRGTTKPVVKILGNLSYMDSYLKKLEALNVSFPSDIRDPLMEDIDNGN